jgi:hypothetical protein
MAFIMAFSHMYITYFDYIHPPLILSSGTTILFSIISVLVYILTNSARVSFPFLQIFTNTYPSILFDKSYSDRCERSHYGFHLHFPSN